MATLDQIIDIQIERKTGAIPRPNFGLPLLVASKPRTAGRVAEYADLDAVGEDFGVTDEAYLWATRFFSQSPRPNKLLVAGTDITTNVAITYADNTTYAFRINGTLVSVTTTTGGSAADVVDDLIAAAGVAGVTSDVAFTDNGDDFDIDPASGEPPYKFEVDSTDEGSYAVTFTSNETPAVVLGAAAEVRDDWFVIAYDQPNTSSASNATYTAIADYADANKKMFGYRTTDSNAVDGASTTDLAYVLNAASYNNTFGILADADTDYSDAALIAQIFTRDPGTVTAKFKTLTGIIPSPLTGAQQAAADAKKLNYYVEVGGVGITQEGTTAVGEFIDVIRDVFWIELNMQADVYSLLVNNAKVPLNNSGIALIEGAVRARLQRAVVIGILNDGSVAVSVPDVSDIPTAQKATRTLPDVTFNATLAGAIHFVKIRGTVAV